MAEVTEQRTLGMAECGWRGMSEGWLLRHLGDVHWRLIAQAMGRQAAVFLDDSGAPVYAAFCAISLRIRHPDLAHPGAHLTVASRLRRLSGTRLISFHSLDLDCKAFADVILITAFIRHGAAGGNAHVQRAQPQGHLDLPQMEIDADGGFVREAGLLYRDLPAIMGGKMLQTDVDPCPTTDFNAAGLLYCANYPALADRAEWTLCRDLSPCALISRKVVYLGNVDPGDPVTASLYRAPTGPHDHSISLTTQGRVIARIVTQKAAIPPRSGQFDV